MKKKILVAGGKGQLGSCINKIKDDFECSYDFRFADVGTLDVTDEDAVLQYFAEYKPDYCINASAYTAVDLAEKEAEKAFAINADGVGYLSEACKEHNAVFIHISTDYVFDGDTNIPYDEDSFTNPLGVYGNSKKKGEELALENNPKTIVIRTSWLYSEFNKNFVKTMLSLFPQKEEMGIVADQFGQPTNANDLAGIIMEIIESPQKKFGIYHFSNYPETTWYDFAKKIAELSGSKVKLNAIATEQYPTPAKRPKRSTFCLDKIERDYHIELKDWEDSLKECVEILM